MCFNKMIHVDRVVERVANPGIHSLYSQMCFTQKTMEMTSDKGYFHLIYKKTARPVRKSILF